MMSMIMIYKDGKENMTFGNDVIDDDGVMMTTMIKG